MSRVVEHDLRMVEEQLVCDCGGELKHTNVCLTGGLTPYEHKCDRCGAQEWHAASYPNVSHKRVEAGSPLHVPIPDGLEASVPLVMTYEIVDSDEDATAPVCQQCGQPVAGAAHLEDTSLCAECRERIASETPTDQDIMSLPLTAGETAERMRAEAQLEEDLAVADSLEGLLPKVTIEPEDANVEVTRQMALSMRQCVAQTAGGAQCSRTATVVSGQYPVCAQHESLTGHGTNIIEGAKPFQMPRIDE